MKRKIKGIAVAHLWTRAIANLAIARATQTGATDKLAIAVARVHTRATAMFDLTAPRGPFFPNSPHSLPFPSSTPSPEPSSP